MKRRRIVIMSSIVFIVLFAFGFVVSRSDLYFEISKNIELFGKVYKEISFNYVDEVNPQEFMRAGIKGMLSKLDPYTVFIDEKNQEDIDLLTNGKYGGVGVSIGVRNDKVTILDVIDGYSAQKQGIRIGDVVESVGDTRVTPEMMDDISSMVKGEPGTTVQMKIIRLGEADTLLFNLVREEVTVKNLVFADFYPENSNNVYLKLSNFSRSAGDEVRSALRQLKEKKEIKSIVLDLRGNPGGLLDVAVDICNKFLKKDLLIVSTRGKDANSEKKYFAVEEPLVGTEKLVVLVNGNSASASEIVAGAIQDHDRGIILGTQSFGKGLVQTIVPLSFNTSLKITTAKYYTPSGRCIQKIDYSKDNQVITEPDSLKTDEFATDNKRVVYSAGGITPDTIVTSKIESDLLKDFLAKGILFNFADNFYYQNSKTDFNKLNDDKIISEFKKFLTETKFNYDSDIEKKMNEIIKHVNEEHNSKALTQTIEKLKSQIKDLFESDFEAGKTEILQAIKIELAQRFSGNQGAVKERLLYDKQFNTALALFNNDESYAKLLNSKKLN